MYKITVPKNLQDIWMISEEGFFPGDPLGEIAKKDFRSPGEVFKFLEKPDALTQAIYGEPDDNGKYAFPLIDEPDDDIEPYWGYIGDQTSYWHRESIKEHACYVTYNLYEAGVRHSYAAALGVFHDCGKKYCAETDNNGEVWFNDSEYVSALLAACWTKAWLPEHLRRRLTAVIYGHLECAMGWNKGTKTPKKFLAEVAEFLESEVDAKRVYGLTCLLGACDEGIRSGGLINTEKVSSGKNLILSA